MKNLLFLIILVVSTAVYAQNPTVPTETIAGKKYYIHTVEQGNTLYGLQRTYGVPVEKIIKDNPGVEKGLNSGQKIKIEVPLETVIHEVQKKETLFGISKTYGVTIESIENANPELVNGLKVGQKIKIPGVEKGLVQNVEIVPDEPVVKDTVNRTNENQITVSFTDTIIDHTVLDHETLYNISKRFMVPVEELQKVNNLKNSKIKPGDHLKIPVKKESIKEIKIREVPPKEIRRIDSTLLYPAKDTYKVAILLPFNLENGGNSQLSQLATEFYMGAQLALDSLEKLGLKCDVYVHDTKTDSLSLKKLFSKAEFKSLDLIIGPLMAENAEIVGRWCKENGIRMVCPVSANTSMLLNNPFIYQAVPSDFTLMQGLARHILDEHSGEQIILVKTGLEKDKLNYEAFRSSFMTLTARGTRPKLIEANMDNYASFLKRGMNTVFVFPTTDRSSANKFNNALNLEVAKYSSSSIYVYGSKDWLNFEDLAIYNTAYIYGYASPNDFSYDYDRVKSLHRKYRADFKTDMTKIAVQGFDVTYFFCAEMLLKKSVSSEVMNEIEMVQAGSGNGFENVKTFILRQENGEFIRLK